MACKRCPKLSIRCRKCGGYALRVGKKGRMIWFKCRKCGFTQTEVSE